MQLFWLVAHVSQQNFFDWQYYNLQKKKIYSLAFRKGINISLPFSTQKHKIIAIKENVDVINDSCKNV